MKARTSKISPARRHCRVRRSTSRRLCPRTIAARPGREESQGWDHNTGKRMPWRRSLWIWKAAGRPCGKKTKETKKRREKDGDKTEDDDQGEAYREVGVGGKRGLVCQRARGCTYMAEPHVALGESWQVHLYGEAARFFFFFSLSPPPRRRCTCMGKPFSGIG